MFCKKCGNPLPKEGYICKFCGAMMDKNQVENQNKLMKENSYQPKFKTELYGGEKINYQENEHKEEKNFLPYAIIGGVIIFLIILAIIINIAR